MPLHFDTDEQRRQFADRLYYSIILCGKETSARLQEEQPFAKSIEYLNKIISKEEMMDENNSSGPATDLMKHLRRAGRLMTLLRSAADPETKPGDRTKLMEEVQSVMDKMSDESERDPDMLCADFYRIYGYGKATNNEMKFIADSFHALTNARCLMNARELREEYEECSSQIEETKVQAGELMADTKAYLKSLNKAGCTRNTFAAFDSSQDALIMHYKQQLKDLEDKNIVSQQHANAKKELAEIEKAYNAKAAPILKSEAQVASINEYMKTLGTAKYKKAFEDEEKAYDTAAEKLAEQDEYIANINERVKNHEMRLAQSSTYAETLETIEKKAPGIGQGLKDYRSWQSRAEALHDAINQIASLALKNVDVGTLLDKKEGYTQEEAEILNIYNNAKTGIIENLSSNPNDAKKTADAFSSLEKSGEDILSSFISKDQATVAFQITTLNQRIVSFEEEYGQYINEYTTTKEALDQNSYSTELMKDANKELTKAEKDRETLYKDLCKAEAKCIARTKEICKKLGIGTDSNIKLTYGNAVSAAEKLRTTLEDKIHVLRSDDDFRVLSDKKKIAEQKVAATSKKGINAKIAAIKNGLALEEKKSQNFKEIAQKRQELKAKLQSISDNRVEIQNNHKNLEHYTVQSKIQHNLLAISTRIMDKSSKERIENRDKNSPEFNAMRDKLDEVFKIVSSGSNATKQEKTAALVELGQVAQRYYDAKMTQFVPDIFASEQRLARLDCAKSLISLGKIAQSIEQEVPECEASVKKFIGANHHVGVNKEFEKNFENMVDEVSLDMHKTEDVPAIERHPIGEFINKELEKLQPENSVSLK